MVRVLRANLSVLRSHPLNGKLDSQSIRLLAASTRLKATVQVGTTVPFGQFQYVPYTDELADHVGAVVTETSIED